MSLTYPVAADALEALTQPVGLERTQAAARRLAGREVIFETEWLRPGPERAEELAADIQSALSMGAAQVYENEKGRPIVALKFWRILTDEELKPKPAPAKPEGGAKAKEDHADDLYFRRGRTKKTKPKPVDPNQMDLFQAPASDASDEA